MRLKAPGQATRVHLPEWVRDFPSGPLEKPTPPLLFLVLPALGLGHLTLALPRQLKVSGQGSSSVWSEGQTVPACDGEESLLSTLPLPPLRFPQHVAQLATAARPGQICTRGGLVPDSQPPCFFRAPTFSSLPMGLATILIYRQNMLFLVRESNHPTQG